MKTVVIQLVFAMMLIVSPIFVNDPPPCFVDCCCACNRAGAICLWQDAHCCGAPIIAPETGSIGSLPEPLQKQRKACSLMKNEPFVATVASVRSNFERLQPFLNAGAKARLEQVDWSLYTDRAVTFNPDRMNLWKLLVQMNMDTELPVNYLNNSKLLMPPVKKNSLWQVVLYVLDPDEYLISLPIE